MERFYTHFMGVSEPNTCTLEGLGFSARDPILERLAKWLPTETSIYIGCKHKWSRKPFENSTMRVFESIELDLSVLN